MLSWFDKTGAGFVSVYIHLPINNIIRRVDFLVDTGAEKTLLHPKDALDLGFSYENLPTKIGIGFGGEFEYYVVKNKEIYFIFLEEKKGKEIYYSIKMNQIQLMQMNYISLHYIKDSVLGRDFINKYELLFSFKKNMINFI